MKTKLVLGPEDIGVGANGQAWAIGGGRVVFWTGTAWGPATTVHPGFSATTIAVSPEGTPWVLDQIGAG